MRIIKKILNPRYNTIIIVIISLFIISFVFTESGLFDLSAIFRLFAVCLIIFTVVGRSKNKSRTESKDQAGLINPVEDVYDSDKNILSVATPVHNISKAGSTNLIKAVQDIESGVLPVFTNSPIVGKGEITHFYCPAIRYITKNRVIGHTAATSGVSLKVAKGVTLRSGGAKGHSVYGDVTGAFLGEFVITNKRIVFIHEQHGFECTIKALKTISNGDNDKVLIQKSDNTCALHLATAVNQKTGKTSIIENSAGILKRAVSLIHDSDN